MNEKELIEKSKKEILQIKKDINYIFFTILSIATFMLIITLIYSIFR